MPPPCTCPEHKGQVPHTTFNSNNLNNNNNNNNNNNILQQRLAQAGLDLEKNRNVLTKFKMYMPPTPP